MRKFYAKVKYFPNTVSAVESLLQRELILTKQNEIVKRKL
jgi:hypothetical protein